MRYQFNPSKLEETIDIYRKTIDQLSQDKSEITRITVKTFEFLLGHFEETLRIAKTREKKLGWYMFAFAPELLVAMDIHPFCSEILVLLLPTIKPDALREICLWAENEGLPPEVCAVDKSLVGMLHAGYLPSPDFILGTGIPCDNMVAGYQIVREHVDAPICIVDAPYGDSEPDLAYYVEETKRMVDFIEKETGKKLDYNKLKEVVEEGNRSLEYLLEINEMRKVIPCPHPGRFITICNFVQKFAAGDPRGTEVFRMIRDYTKKMVLEGKGVVPEEKNRTIWFHLPTYFDLSIIDWLEETYGVVVPMDMFSYQPIEPIDTSSIDSMLRGLAIKSLNTPMLRQFRGPSEFYTDDLVRVCEDYRADSVVFAGHVGCKHGWGSMGLVKDTCKEIGVPLLIFDMDGFDPGPTTAQDARDKLRQFFDTIAPRG